MKKLCNLFFAALIVLLFPCYAIAQAGMWTWMHGTAGLPNVINFGIQGVPAASNNPPGFYEACEWTDLSGNFWIYGGESDIMQNDYADLWKFDPLTNMWTWINGPGTPNSSPIYGTQGIPAAANNPGQSAWGVVTWVDKAGNLWLNGSMNGSNSLWKYTISTNMWTWMKGDAVNLGVGNYGIKKVPAPSNLPPGRSETNARWVDADGNLWMFGGYNYLGYLNDLWKYDVGTNEWTWIRGSQYINDKGHYGIQHVPDAGNDPPARCCWSPLLTNPVISGSLEVPTVPGSLMICGSMIPWPTPGPG